MNSDRFLSSNHFFPCIIVEPKPVGTVTVTEKSETSASIRWPANSEPVDEYEITLTDSTGVQQTFRVPGNETMKTVKLLKSDQHYAVKVKAIKDGSAGRPSDLNIFTTLKIG